MVIGPHGGAFANMIFAPAETSVIEFLPLCSLERCPCVHTTLRHAVNDLIISPTRAHSTGTDHSTAETQISGTFLS